MFIEEAKDYLCITNDSRRNDKIFKEKYYEKMKKHERIHFYGIFPDFSIISNYDNITKIVLIHFTGNLTILPRNIKKLYLGDFFNKSIDILKDYDIKNLTIGKDFNKTIKNLPLYLKKLKLSTSFNKILGYFDKKNNVYVSFLPETLESFIIEGHYDDDYYVETLFDKEMEPYLPQNLKFLRMSDSYIGTINNLPQNLHTLHIGSFFNQPVDNLPSSLRSIHFGDSFNQPIDNLPNGIEIIELCGDFNQPIDNLPCSLKELLFVYGESKFTYEFNQNLDNLPESIVNLSLVYSSFNKNLNNLPRNLSKLELSKNFNNELKNLPSKLDFLEIGNDFNQSLEFIPESVTSICFNSGFNQWDTVPDFIKHITFDSCFNKIITKLPLQLETLCFNSNFKKNICHLFSNEFKNLKEIELYNCSDKTIDFLPDCVEKLSIHCSIPDIKKLPKNLRFLKINTFKAPYSILPDKLETFCLRVHCGNFIDLPKSLRFLVIEDWHVNLLENIPENVEKVFISFHVKNDKFLILGLKKEKEKWANLQVNCLSKNTQIILPRTDKSYNI